MAGMRKSKPKVHAPSRLSFGENIDESLGRTLASRYALECSRLRDHEAVWRDRYTFLQERGYLLRPRYNPEWIPSWTRDGLYTLPDYREDSILLPPHDSDFIDATSISNGQLLMLKRVPALSEEAELLATIASGAWHSDRNHCVPIMDMFEDFVEAVQDATDSDLESDPDNDICDYTEDDKKERAEETPEQKFMIVVMPFLRPMNDPPFRFVNDIVCLIDQLLEGMVYMHERGVAHRECISDNVMLDARALYPQGFHPVATNLLPDLTAEVHPLPRIVDSSPVKYYYVGFSSAIRFQPGIQPKLATGQCFLEQPLPEFVFGAPYDPFKVDVYALGHVFRTNIYEKYVNVGFLGPLVAAMTTQNPNNRPDAAGALKHWRQLRNSIYMPHRVWRLRRRTESLPLNVVQGAIDILVVSLLIPVRFLRQWIPSFASLMGMFI